MDFELSPKHKLMKRVIRRFTDEEVIPYAAEHDRKGTFNRAAFDKLSKMGFSGLVYPREYGGAGVGFMEVGIVGEELSRGCASFALAHGAHMVICGHTISRVGSHDQKLKYLVPLAKGEKMGAFGLTEPGAGSDATNIQTTARRDGDNWILNGNKMFITNAPEAGVFVIVASTDRGKGTKGMSLFLVEPSFPGFSVGQKLDKMGMRGSLTAELVMEDCVVPGGNMMGEEGKGIRYALGTLDFERSMAPLMATGIAQGAYEIAVEYAKQRVQFGQPVANFQAVQFMLAEMLTEIEISRNIGYKVAWMTDQGMNINTIASIGKLYTSEMATRVALQAVQVMGGYGYMKDFPVERMVRDAKLLEIGGGTSQIQKLIIARDILR